MSWSATAKPEDPSKIASYKGTAAHSGVRIERDGWGWLVVDFRAGGHVAIGPAREHWSDCIALAETVLAEAPLGGLI